MHGVLAFDKIDNLSLGKYIMIMYSILSFRTVQVLRYWVGRQHDPTIPEWGFCSGRTKERIVAAACAYQKHVTNVSQHGSMGKSDGAMPFSLSCHKVMNYSESAKT